MERLTYKKGNHYYSNDKCIVKVIAISENSLDVMQNILDKLGAYEDAEEHGRYHHENYKCSERCPLTELFCIKNME